MDVIDAALHGDLERVRALVEVDAGLVHATDNEGWTPLLSAVYGGRVEVAQYLLEHGAAANHRDNHRQTSALHLACSWGHPGIVLLMLQKGADVTAVGYRGTTPLISAASGGADYAVRALLEHGGSDVDAASDVGRTACHWACKKGGVLRQLLEAGADPMLRDDHGRTAVDLAHHYRHHDCVRTLQEWDRAYLVRRVRCLQSASSSPPSNTPQPGS